MKKYIFPFLFSFCLFLVLGFSFPKAVYASTETKAYRCSFRNGDWITHNWETSVDGTFFATRVNGSTQGSYDYYFYFVTDADYGVLTFVDNTYNESKGTYYAYYYNQSCGRSAMGYSVYEIPTTFGYVPSYYDYNFFLPTYFDISSADDLITKIVAGGSPDMNGFSDKDGVNGVLNIDDLGYLQNVSATVSAYNNPYSTDDAFVNDAYIYYEKISFSPITSTGVNLARTGYDVQYCVIGVENASDWNFKDPFNKAGLKSNCYLLRNNDMTDDGGISSNVPANHLSDNLGVLYINHASDKFINLSNVWGGSSAKDITVWMRPVKTSVGSIEYGGWSVVTYNDVPGRLDFSSKVVGSVTNGYSDDNSAGTLHIVDKNGFTGHQSLADDYYTSSVNSSSSSHDGAYSFSDLISSGADTDTYYNYAEGMIEGVGNFPSLIGEIFSFLPPWVLGFMALAFATSAILLIVKIIRG